MQVRPLSRPDEPSGRETLDLQRIDESDRREQGRADFGVEKADIGMGLVLDGFGLGRVDAPAVVCGEPQDALVAGRCTDTLGTERYGSWRVLPWFSVPTFPAVYIDDSPGFAPSRFS